jgi:predicted anti-sigma-YlaC factor YlaD
VQNLSEAVGDILMAARVADHLAHCPPCRERAEQAEARYAAYGASMARRDRVQLGLHLARRTTAVTG